MRRSWFFFVIGLIAGPMLALVIVLSGLWPWRGTAVPPGWETRLATRSLHIALARDAKDLRPPFQVSDDTLVEGMKIFRNNCAGCHGEFGKPSSWGTAGFYPRVPQFTDAPPSLPPEQMYLLVRDGVRYSGMGAWKDLMSEDDTWKVVLFLSNLKSLPPTVRSQWQAKPAK